MIPFCRGIWTYIKVTLRKSEALKPTWTPLPGLKRPAARSGQWHLSPSTMKKSDKIWSLLQRCLDICESYFKNVWYLAAILDALARLQKTISRNLICANSARSTPTKFFTARSLRQWLLYMYYLNFQPWKVKWADHISEIRWLSRSMQGILFLKWWENKITGGYTCPPVPN